MAEESTQSIEIDAPAERVMAVIADFPAYPEWAASVKEVHVLATGAGRRPGRVRFLVDAGPVKDDYTLDYIWAPDGRRVDWQLVEARMQKAQRGSYVLDEKPGGTTVTYSLAVDLGVPMLGLLKRKAEKVIMDTALRELKKRVESRA